MSSLTTEKEFINAVRWTTQNMLNQCLECFKSLEPHFVSIKRVSQ